LCIHATGKIGINNDNSKKIIDGLNSIETGGQKVMWCAYWPISRQHGDV